jgi:hypothetical protein
VRDTDAVLDLGSGSGKGCYIAAQVVGLFGSRAALNYISRVHAGGVMTALPVVAGVHSGALVSDPAADSQSLGRPFDPATRQLKRKKSVRAAHG